MDNRYLKRLALMQQDVMSERKYNVMIGLHLLYGIGLTALVCFALGTYLSGIYFAHPFLFTIAFFVISFAGTSVALSGTYRKAFLGYTITVLGFGGMLATALPYYTLHVIFGAAMMTLIVIFVMMMAAAVMPDAFLGLGKTLFWAVIGMIIAELISMLFGFYNTNVFGVVGTFIFALYVGYDWAKGQRYPKVSMFAVYTALELYMDIINIFIRLLSLSGKESGD